MSIEAQQVVTPLAAMKQALEVLSSSMYPQPQQMNAIDTLRQAITEAEKQEPVAWLDRTCLKNLSDCFEPTISKKPVSEYDVPLYTMPPQRQWVGLTESEIIMCSSVSILRFYDAIEAKLKQKNGFAEEKNT